MGLASQAKQRAKREARIPDRIRELAEIEMQNLPRKQGDALGSLQWTDFRTGKVRRWTIRIGDRADRITMHSSDGRATTSRGWTWILNHIHPFHHLQLWNCFSANFSIVEINFLSGLRVSVRMKDGQWAEGIYLWTMQWGPDYTNGADLSLALDPSEHKSGHFIALDCGEFAVQPNNRLRWHEPSHVTKPFPERPDYVVNEHEWSCEAFAKWATEDSNAWHYDIAKTPLTPNTEPPTLSTTP